MYSRAALVAFLVLSSGPWVSAQSTPPDNSDALARNHFEAGRAYFAQAQYDDSAREFEEAYRLSHRVPLLLNLARAYEEGDRERDAIGALDRWLAASPESDPARVEVTERRARLLTEAERREAAEAAAAQVAVTSTTSAPPPPSEQEPSRALFFTGIGALSLAGAATALSLGTGIAAHGIHEDLDRVCAADGTCPASETERIDRGQRLARTSTAFTFIGIGAAAAGVVLLIVGRDDSDASPGTATVVVPYADRTGGGALLRFSY